MPGGLTVQRWGTPEQLLMEQNEKNSTRTVFFSAATTDSDPTAFFSLHFGVYKGKESSEGGLTAGLSDGVKQFQGHNSINQHGSINQQRRLRTMKTARIGSPSRAIFESKISKICGEDFILSWALPSRVSGHFMPKGLPRGSTAPYRYCPEPGQRVGLLSSAPA